MEKVEVRIRKRGIKAGMLTFFLGPPLGGFAFGLIAAVSVIIVKVVDNALEPPTIEQALIALIGLLLAPIGAAMWSYLVAAAPAAVAATYVSIRVGTAKRLSWMETIILSIVCLAFTPSGADRDIQYDYLLRNWRVALILVPSSLFAALTLRYLAGRWGLVR